MSVTLFRIKRDSGRRIFFPWETRRSRLALFTRRHLRLAAIFGVVALIAWGLIRMESRRRAVFSTRATIGTIMRSVDAFRADHDGRCPTNLAELVSPTDGHDPYLARTPRDGWGRDFRFRCPGRKHPSGADVSSAGPSGEFDDTDQIE